MGRPTNCTTELAAQIAATVRIPMPLIGAANIHGVPERTVMRWMADGAREDATEDDPYRQFRQVIDEARADVLKQLLTTVTRAAWTHGDVKAAQWLLERMFPEEFGNRAKVEHSGAVTAAVDFVFTDDPAAQEAARALLDAVIPSDVHSDA